MWSSWGKLSQPLSPASDDSGAVTVLAVFAVFAILAFTIGCFAVGSVVVARHRAQSAADLAALAAAARVPAGPQAVCLRAQAVTAAMGARLRGCEVSGLDVTVRVAAETGLRMGAEALASARAGPSGRD